MATAITPSTELRIQSAEYLEPKFDSGKPAIVCNTHRLLVDLVAFLHNEMGVDAYIQCLGGDCELPYVLVCKCGKATIGYVRIVCTAYVTGMSVYHCY